MSKLKEATIAYEFDVSYDYISKRYTVMVDTGEVTVYFTRSGLEEMLGALDEAEESQ